MHKGPATESNTRTVESLPLHPFSLAFSQTTGTKPAPACHRPKFRPTPAQVHNLIHHITPVPKPSTAPNQPMLPISAIDTLSATLATTRAMEKLKTGVPPPATMALARSAPRSSRMPLMSYSGLLKAFPLVLKSLSSQRGSESEYLDPVSPFETTPRISRSAHLRTLSARSLHALCNPLMHNKPIKACHGLHFLGLSPSLANCSYGAPALSSSFSAAHLGGNCIPHLTYT